MCAERACPVGAGGGVAGFTAEQVEEVRMVVRMLPVFLTTILYWTIYAQARAAAARRPPAALPRCGRGRRFRACFLSCFPQAPSMLLNHAASLESKHGARGHWP